MDDLASVYGKETIERLCKLKVLLVGAGGIGCEVLKNLVILGIKEIKVASLIIFFNTLCAAQVDLDTIDISNLNRQFLFQRRHVGQSKSQVAVESCLRFIPSRLRETFKLTSYRHNVMDTKLFDCAFFSSFDVVINALDNVEARKHVNTMCIQANVPMLETGTAGYFGQNMFMMNRITECYDCFPKPTPKTFAVCTIRSTPSAPIHCIVWAKSHLLGKLFSREQEDQIAANEITPENAEQFKLIREENEKFKRLLEGRYNKDFGHKVFAKVFQDDPSALAELKDLWKDRPAPPKSLDLLVQEDEANVSSFDERKLWDLRENTLVFFDSMKRLNERYKKGDTIAFDKDDEDTMDFVVSAANLRSLVYGIKTQSRFQAKSMAGNIIPAIASTNAIVSGLAILNLIRVAEALPVSNITRTTCCNTYLTFHTNLKRLLAIEFSPEPNPTCAVCQTNRAVLEGDETLIGDLTIEQFLSKFVFARNLLQSSDVSVMCGSKLLFDPDFDDNAQKPFKSLKLGHGDTLCVRDEDGDEPALYVFIQKVDGANNKELALVVKADLIKKHVNKKRSREEEDDDDEIGGGDDDGKQGVEDEGPVKKATKTESVILADDDSIVID